MPDQSATNNQPQRWWWSR